MSSPVQSSPPHPKNARVLEPHAQVFEMDSGDEGGALAGLLLLVA